MTHRTIDGKITRKEIIEYPNPEHNEFMFEIEYRDPDSSVYVRHLATVYYTTPRVDRDTEVGDRVQVITDGPTLVSIRMFD